MALDSQQRDAMLYHIHRLPNRPVPPSAQDAGIALIQIMIQITNVPFRWEWVDRPDPGSIAVVYHGPHPSPAPPLPSDGLRYVDNGEALSRHNVSVPHPSSHGQQFNLIVEQYDFRLGLVPPEPGQTLPPDQRIMNRFRRRFRIVSGAPHPGIWFVYWGLNDGSSGALQSAPPGWESQPVRQYPLPPVPDAPHSIAPYIQQSSQQSQQNQFQQQQHFQQQQQPNPGQMQPAGMPQMQPPFPNGAPPQHSPPPSFMGAPQNSPIAAANPSPQPPQTPQQQQQPPGAPRMTIDQATSVLTHVRQLQARGEQIPPNMAQLFMSARTSMFQHQQALQQQAAAQQGGGQQPPQMPPPGGAHLQPQPTPPQAPPGMNMAAGPLPPAMAAAATRMQGVTAGTGLPLQPSLSMSAPQSGPNVAGLLGGGAKPLPGIASSNQGKSSQPPGSPPKPRLGQPPIGGAAALMGAMKGPGVQPEAAAGGMGIGIGMGDGPTAHEPDLLDRMETLALAEMRYKQNHAYLDWIFAAWSQGDLLEDWVKERIDVPSASKEGVDAALTIEEVESARRKREDEERRRKDGWREKIRKWEEEGEASVRNHEETLQSISSAQPPKSATTAMDPMQIVVQCS